MNEVVSNDDMLLYIDTVVNDAITNHDTTFLMQYGRSVNRSFQAHGVALMKLLYLMEVNWQAFGIDDNFVDTVHAEMGLSSQTIRKYKDTWRRIFENPNIGSDVKERLLGKSVKSLLLLAPAAGDTPEDIEWDVIVDSTTDSEVQEEVRRVRGEVTNSGTSVLISMGRDGTLYAQRGKGGVKKPFGYFNLEACEDDPDLNKAKERLVNSGGIYIL